MPQSHTCMWRSAVLMVRAPDRGARPTCRAPATAWAAAGSQPSATAPCAWCTAPQNDGTRLQRGGASGGAGLGAAAAALKAVARACGEEGGLEAAATNVRIHRQSTTQNIEPIAALHCSPAQMRSWVQSSRDSTRTTRSSLKSANPVGSGSRRHTQPSDVCHARSIVGAHCRGKSGSSVQWLGQLGHELAGGGSTAAVAAASERRQVGRLSGGPPRAAERLEVAHSHCLVLSGIDICTGQRAAPARKPCRCSAAEPAPPRAFKALDQAVRLQRMPVRHWRKPPQKQRVV